jgi:hypothetical protein
MLEEHIFYNDLENEITITNTRIVVNQKVFSINHLVSFEVSEEEVKAPTILLLFSFAGIIFGALNNPGFLGASFFILIVVLIMWFINYFRRFKGLVLTFSSGEEIVLNHDDKFPQIIEALNNSIIFRG